MSLWNFGTGIGLHALVIGAGHYPALPGGGNTTVFPQHGGMGQLTSASHSAISFANWLTKDYRHSTVPLRSLELLISEAGTTQYTAAGQTLTVERATFANLQQRILDWTQRANSSDQNRAIFYFCGHGISAGLQSTLLLEDFGTVANAPLLAALDFTAFYRAMDQCRAREQLFLVDACRVASPMLFTAQYYGNPVLTPGKPTIPPRSAPIFYSAVPGATAYGRANQPSFFTEALVKALSGSGAAKKNAKLWTILPSVLYRSVSRRLGEAVAGSGVGQVCTVDQLIDFDVHELAGIPEIPVTISCNPPIDGTTDRLIASSTAGNREQLPPLTTPWRLNLPFGQYRFTAAPPAGTPFFVDDVVVPPFTDVVLP
jgi:hypothetical protein